MAAVVSIVQKALDDYSGGSEVGKLVFYFLRIDNNTANKFNFPVYIPDAGVNYSYEVWLRALLDFPPDTKVFNMKFWYASGLPANHTITVNDDIVSEYVKPVDTESVQGNRDNFHLHNSEVLAIDLDGELINIGDYSSFAVFQLEINSSAAKGAYDVEWLFQYDEI